MIEKFRFALKLYFFILLSNIAFGQEGVYQQNDDYSWKDSIRNNSWKIKNYHKTWVSKDERLEYTCFGRPFKYNNRMCTRAQVKSLKENKDELFLVKEYYLPVVKESNNDGWLHKEGFVDIKEWSWLKWYTYYETGEIEWVTNYYGNSKSGIEFGLDKSGDTITYNNYKENKRDGYQTSYHLNGQLYYKIMFKAGKRIGESVFYHDNGKIDSWGFYNESGKKDGKFINYDSLGQIIRIRKYNDGVFEKGQLTGYQELLFKHNEIGLKAFRPDDHKIFDWEKYNEINNVERIIDTLFKRKETIDEVRLGLPIGTIGGYLTNPKIIESTSGDYFMTSSDESAGILWNKKSKVPLYQLNYSATITPKILLSPNESRILTVCRYDNSHLKQPTSLWDFNNGDLIAVLWEENESILDACFTPDGKYILVIDRKGNLITFDGITGTKVHKEFIDANAMTIQSCENEYIISTNKVNSPKRIVHISNSNRTIKSR